MKNKHQKKILIAGGTGFIGYHLAKRSLKKKWSVTSLSSSFPKKYRIQEKVKYIVCDISKKNILERKIKGNYNYVVNLSGHVDHKNKTKVYKSHFEGCKNLVDFFERKKIDSFIQIGSSMEYGKIRSPHKEYFKCKPKSHYGLSKYLSTKYLIKRFKKKKFPGTVLRLYQVYGPNQDSNRLISSVILGCISNKTIYCSHGRQIRNFIFVDDVINSIFKALKSKKAKGEIFNIGQSKSVEVKKVINKIRYIIKKGKPIFGKKKLRKEENLKVYPSIYKAKKILRWVPKYSFAKGLSLTINSYTRNSS